MSKSKMVDNKTKQIQLIIGAIGVITVVVLFGFWCKTDDTVNKAGYVAAVVSVLLFTVICLITLHRCFTEFDSRNSDEHLNIIEKNAKVTVATIFAQFILYDFFVLVLIHAIRVIVFKDQTNFFEGLNLFLHIDSGYYLKIAEQWYLNTEEYIYDLVFYPGYPILIKAANFIFNNYLLSGIVVSGVFYAASASLLFQLIRLESSKNDAFRAIKYFALLPASLFFAAPMSESTFIFTSILAIYLARKEKWLMACISGAYCAFTRSLGIIIIIPLAYIAVLNIIRDKENRKVWIKRLLASFAVCLGILAYLFINYLVTGYALAFSEIEYEKWGQSLGLFFDTLAFQIDNALADIQQPYFISALGLWFPNVAYSFAVLLLMLFTANKLRAEYDLWFICYFVIAIGATYLISAPRYLVACLPIYPAIVEITKKKKTDVLLTIICIVFSLYYLFAFSARWEVF